MSPHNLDLYEAEVLAHHELSSEELALLKKYRRQIRNRESAQNSRARKRQHVEVLEEQVAALTAERDALRLRVAQLEGRGPRLGGVVLMLVFSFGLLGMLQYPPRALPGISPASASASSSSSSSASRQLLQVPEVASPPPSPPAARMRIVEEEKPPSLIRQHDKPSDYSLHWDRPNTDYLYCPAAHHVLSSSKDGASPAHVSLVLPAEAFNNSLSFKDKAPPLVEVTCAVVDIWPVYLGNHNGLTAK
jgi:hypothetical protein